MQNFQDIIDDFDLITDWDDRYAYIIDLGKQLAPLNENEQNEATRVKGCASQVWLVFDAFGPEEIRFRGNSDAMIVRGLIAVLQALFNGKTPAEVQKIDAAVELGKIDLQGNLSGQRSNGLVSMVQRIQHVAQTANT